jgi:GNAT superfamily N-acetyltransferase/uncharacterized glyoxalase superfamily protein PhnB
MFIRNVGMNPNLKPQTANLKLSRMIFRHSVPILRSEDIRRSIAYYTDILGFENKWEWDDPPSFGGVSKNSVEIFFCEKGQGQPGTWLSIMVDKVDELYESIRSKGGKILMVPEDKEWGLREMLVEDPDGHIIRFGSSVTTHREKSDSLAQSARIIKRSPTAKEYQELVKAVGWHIKTDALVEKVLAAVVFAAVAEDPDSGNAIGCVLLLGDHASFYYIKDMMVHPEWQSKRVGTALMETVNEWLEKNAPDHALVGLYTGENLAPFYRQFGFSPAFGMCRRMHRG